MSLISFSPDMRIVPFLTHNDREICFVNREIVELFARFLDRAQDVLSFGSVNHCVHNILIANPSPSFRRFFLNLSNILPSIDFIERPVASWAIVPSSPPSTSNLQTQIHNFLTGPIRAITITEGRLIHTPDLDIVNTYSASYGSEIQTYSRSYEGMIQIWDTPSGSLLSSTPQSPPSGLMIHNGLFISALGSGPHHPISPEDSSEEDSSEQDFYTNFVELTNNLRHETALQSNTDGGQYLKSVIDEHMQTLSDDDRVEFKKKMGEIDEELFTVIPHLAVKKAISSTVPLTRKNTPHFMHAHLKHLEQLRLKQKSLTAADLMKECGRIATELQRETDCIVSMQKALQSFS